MTRRAIAAMLLVLGQLLGACAWFEEELEERPDLPTAEAMPGINAEDLIERLEGMAFICHHDPGGDIPAHWACRLDVGERLHLEAHVVSDAVGPIESVNFSFYQMNADPARLNAFAADSLWPLIEVVVPADPRPERAIVEEAVRELPRMDLGDGWYASFNGSSDRRSVLLIYSADGETDN